MAVRIGMLGYLSLHLIWLKFFIIWRFFRFFALADGVEVVENMNRCMSNNYNLQGFWRSWHRSFNRWLIRYVFVPLGGSRHRFRNTFAVFTFTAVWHDLSLSLLTWGWMLAVFIVPESLLTAYVARPSMKGAERTLVIEGCFNQYCEPPQASEIRGTIGTCARLAGRSTSFS